MSQGVMATAPNAVSNSSRTPVAEDEIFAILSTGDGPGHLVRALFGDCSFETLDRLGAAHGLARATIRAAYAHARAQHAAFNAELESGELWRFRRPAAAPSPPVESAGRAAR